MTLDEIIQLFLANRIQRNCGTHAIKAYRQHLTLFKNWLDPTDSEQVTCEDLNNFLAKLKEQNLSPTTIRQRATALRTFFKWTALQGLTKSDPSARMFIPRKPRRLPKCLKPDEIKTLVTTELPTREKALLYLILDSGMRRNEVAQLKLDDVDLPRRMAHVRHGKGDKERWVIFAEKACEALETWIKERNALPGINHLFTTKDGEAMKPGGIYKAVKRAAIKAGVPARPHRLRHTFATNYLDRGGNLHDLQMLMGHESITTTMVYVSVSLEKLRAKHHQLSMLEELLK